MARKYNPKPADEIRRNMSAIRSKNNRTEVALRKRLHALGHRYALHVNDLPGRPDLVFKAAKVAVFIDGDFWHARTLRERGLSALKSSLRTAKRDYWLEKFTRRIARDDAVTQALRDNGWLVIRLWESEVKSDLEAAVKRISRMIRSRRKRS
jgi:DNA mismatch endonuclease, patch repair protein